MYVALHSMPLLDKFPYIRLGYRLWPPPTLSYICVLEHTARNLELRRCSLKQLMCFSVLSRVSLVRAVLSMWEYHTAIIHTDRITWLLYVDDQNTDLLF